MRFSYNVGVWVECKNRASNVGVEHRHSTVTTAYFEDIFIFEICKIVQSLFFLPKRIVSADQFCTPLVGDVGVDVLGRVYFRFAANSSQRYQMI